MGGNKMVTVVIHLGIVLWKVNGLSIANAQERKFICKTNAHMCMLLLRNTLEIKRLCRTKTRLVATSKSWLTAFAIGPLIDVVSKQT